MAIISGGTTIIDNGSLTDGIVVAGDLASNSVTSAKIASSAVTDAKIAGMSSSKLSGALPALDGSSLTNLPGGGKVLQVVQTAITTSQIIYGTGSFTDISGFSASITPSSTSSKVLFQLNACVANSEYGGAKNCLLRLLRGSTVIGAGTSVGSRSACLVGVNSIYTALNAPGMANSSAAFLDTPSTTSSTTYKIQLLALFSATTVVNRTHDDNNASQRGRPISTITLMEIGS